MKRAIYPLYAPADESRVKPILDALKKKGVAVRAADPRKGDALMLFLSESLAADGPEADAFFRLNAGRALVIPVNLDGCTPPEELQRALMARHGLDGQKYGPEELADRIATAAMGDRRNRLPLILSLAAVALLLVGGIVLFQKRQAPPPPLPPTPIPATPTPEPVFPKEVDLTLQELEQVHELILVGDGFYAFSEDDGTLADRGIARVGAEHVANRSFTWEEGRAHWYSAEDGHEYALYDWGDLSFLPYMKNLMLLTLVQVEGTLPDLSGLQKLDCVELFDCAIDDISGVKGRRLQVFNYHGPVLDFSPLNECPQLNTVFMNLYGTAEADLSGFGPANLRSLNLSLEGEPRTANLSRLKSCRKLEEVRLANVPILDLACLSNASALSRVHLRGMERLTSLQGLNSKVLLDSVDIDGCFQLRDLSALSSCVNLDKLYLQDCPVSDLSFLAGCRSLKQLSLSNMETLRSFHGLEDHVRLRQINTWNLRNLTDISALSGCTALESLTMFECFALRDLTPVTKLPKLRDLQLYGVDVNDVDFLWDIENKEYFSFGIAEVPNWEGLAAIEKYSYLNITDRNGSALPYVQNATVTDFELWNRGGRGNQSEGLDVTLLPHVTNELLLHCVRSLEGLDQPNARRLILDDCPYLASLSGLEGMPRMQELEIYNCPRLNDWSALTGRSIYEIHLEGLFSLPDFGNVVTKNITLTTIFDLKDLSCFENYKQDWYSISLMDVDGVTDLSPLYHLKGKSLQVPAHLMEQAQAMVDSGLLEAYQVVYPEGGWAPVHPDIALTSLEEIESLPSALLARIESLTLAGDTIVPDEEAHVEEDWSTYPPTLYICYDGEEERIPVESGTLTDLTCLEKLTGLEGLTVYAQPELTSLEGIEALSDLKRLNVIQAPALTDASAAFTVQSLEELRFWFTDVRSIQGIQNLYALRRLDLNDNPVDDLSPLAACGALEDVNFQLPMMTFEELKTQPEAVRRYIKSLSIAGEYVYAGGPWWFEEDWVTDPPKLYLHSNETDERLPLLAGAVTDMGELAALLPNLEQLDLYGQDLTTLDGVEDFPQLRRITIEECRKITDFSALWRSSSLGDISLRNEPIDSIAGIEQLPRLIGLSLSGTNVRDFSPLARVDYSYCTSEDYNGWGFWVALDVTDSNKLTYEDYGVLEAVPVYWGLNMNNVPVDRWLGHVMDKEMHDLSCHGSGISNEQLRAFVAAHPMLEQLDLRWNPQLTDLSCLRELPNDLRQLFLSGYMQQAVDSLGEGYDFRLEIE